MKTSGFAAMALLCIILNSCSEKQLSSEKSVTNNESPIDQFDRNAVLGENDQSDDTMIAQQNQITTKFQPESTQKENKPSAPATAVDWDRKIIKTANLRYEVKEVQQYGQFIFDKVKFYGGYVANEEFIEEDGVNIRSMVIKVPVASFTDLVNELQKDVTKTVVRNIKTDDVTAQLVDTRARLEARKEMRLKYLEFLRQAKNMQEALQVQSEVNGIQEEIEAASQRIQQLKQQTAFSTIHISFYQPEATVGQGKQPSFFSKLTQSFKNGAVWLMNAIVFFANIWPIFLLLFAAILYRQSSRNRIKRMLLRQASAKNQSA